MVETRPQVAALHDAYVEAKQAAEDGPGAAYRQAKYELDLAIERAGYADGNRGALAQARAKLNTATREYHRALEQKQAAEEREWQAEMTRKAAQEERERLESRQRHPVLPPVPAPDIAAMRRDEAERLAAR